MFGAFRTSPIEKKKEKSQNWPQDMDCHFCDNNIIARLSMEKRILALDTLENWGVRPILIPFLIKPHYPPSRHDISRWSTRDAAKTKFLVLS